MTLAEFLLARIAEDEALLDDDRVFGGGGEIWTAEAHARVLVECEAKRRIAGLHSAANGACETCYIYAEGVSDNVDYCPTLRLLALPYADHEQFQEEWHV